jgi:hypothetical protein
MYSISYLISQYQTINAAAKALGVHREQLKRLADAGAIYDAFSGDVWIKSKTKLDKAETAKK